MIKFSLIIPAYNEEKKIAKTLESLINQSYKNYELLVIDNNSTDKTNEIAHKYTKNVYIEAQKGYIHAANKGASLAKGEFIAFCDADSVYPANWLKKAAALAQKNPNAAAIYGTCSTYDANFIFNFLNYYFFTGFLIISRLMGLDNTSGFNFMFKRDLFLKINGFDPNFTKMSPDIYLGKRLAKEGKIVFSPFLIVYSSFRRFSHGGIIKTTIFFIKNWWQVIRGKDPIASYEEYNKEIR